MLLEVVAGSFIMHRQLVSSISKHEGGSEYMYKKGVTFWDKRTLYD